MKFRPYDMNEQMLLPPNLSELIDQDDTVRVVSRVIDQLNSELLCKPFKGERGYPPYNPSMMMKLLLYGYTQGIYSCRKLEKAVKRDINFMWICAYQRPDFITINRFRGKYFKEILEEVFAEVVLVLLNEGYIKGEDYFVDGTKVKADANKHKVIWKKNSERYKDMARQRASEIIDEANRLNDVEIPQDTDPEGLNAAAEKVEESIDEDTDSKSTRRKKKSLSKKLKEESSRIAEYEKQQETLGERNSYSKTDEDATFMKMKNDEILPAYNLQVGTQDGFVTGVTVHQNANDGKVFREHVERRAELGIANPQNIIADAGYGYRNNYDYLEYNGMEAYIKYPGYWAENKNSMKSRYKHFKFKMDDSGEIHCPAGYKMRKEDELLHFNASVYICEFCGICPNKLYCIGRDKEHKRLEVNRHYRHQQKRARKLLETNTGRRLYSRRANEVESVFGDMKHNQKFTHFSLRGLENVQAESYLYMLAYNLRKMGTVGVLRPLNTLVVSLYSFVCSFIACFGGIFARWANYRTNTENIEGCEKIQVKKFLFGF